MISLKYIKVWSGFPLMSAYVRFQPSYSSNIGAKGNARPSLKAQEQKPNPPWRDHKALLRIPRIQIHPVTLTMKNLQTFASQNPFWTSAQTSCCTTFLPKYPATEWQAVTPLLG